MTVKGKLVQSQNIKVRQVSLGQIAGATTLDGLDDTNLVETEDGILIYDISTDKYVLRTNIDGGTY